MSAVVKKGGGKVEMNMTPMIDVTFQLIIFFMLVNNIAGEETVQLLPPMLDKSVAKDLQEGDRLVINVVPQDFVEKEAAENPLNRDGIPKAVRVGQDDFAPDDFEGIKSSVSDYVASIKARDATAEPMVVLRADSALYYDAVQSVMGAITAAGVEKINLVAFIDPDKQ